MACMISVETSNGLATVVVAKGEGEFGKSHPSAVVQEALTD